MKLTNKFNLPDVVVRAIESDPYSSGDADISTTRLIGPPRLVTLAERHKDELEEDVSERIWSLLGQAVHVVLERAGKGEITEKRLFAEVGGWKLSGAIDLIDGGTIFDHKVTSCWSYIYRSRMDDWAAQGNVNMWLASKNGIHADKLQNILILRDWIQSKADVVGYPPVQIVTVDLPVWGLKETEEYIKKRIKLHQEARKADDKELPMCTAEERWYNERTERFARCENFCPARSVCSYGNKRWEK
jgi:hypothetical protein